MAKTRDSYRVTGRTAEELTRELNFLLARIADRMDRIEGIRGTATIESDLDMNGQRVTDVGSAQATTDAVNLGQADVEGTAVTLASLAVTGVLTVGGNTTLTGDASVSGNVYVYDANGTLIHSME